VQQEAEIRFETLLRAAVQEAARFPAAAKAMGRQGRVRVRFDFLDGKVSNLQIVQSEDFPPFDQAALAAVEEAHYPPVPPHLQHQLLHLTVWVEFLKRGY
jgi:protein TonB